MESTIAQALAAGGTVDITTIGRKSGTPHRLEIYFHSFDGDNYITGRPGFPRDWLANLTTNPEFTIHLRNPATDLPVVAEIVTDSETRRAILYRILTESWGTDPAKANGQLDRWVEDAPLIRFSPVG